MLNKKIILIILILVLSFSAIIFLVSGNNEQKVEEAYQAGWNAAEKRLGESGYYDMSSENHPVRSISGIVESVSGDNLIVKINPLGPLADPDLDKRVVNISKAKIFKIEDKDDETYKKELNDFRNKVKGDPEPSVKPPVGVIEKEVERGAIAPGVKVTVSSSEDIRNLKNISGDSVVIRE